MKPLGDELKDILKRARANRANIEGDLYQHDAPDVAPSFIKGVTDVCELVDQGGVCRGTGWYVPDRPVGHPLFAKGMDSIEYCICSKEKMKGKQKDHYMHYSNTDKDMLTRMSFDTFYYLGNQISESVKEAYDAAKKFADEPVGWLTFIGASGVGKTHLAVAIIAKLLEKGDPAYYAYVPELLNQMKDTFKPDSKKTTLTLINEIKGKPFLVLDQYLELYW